MEASDLSFSSKKYKPGSRARLMRIAQEMEAGFRFAEKFDEVRVVTFYGSARTTAGSPMYQKAYDLAYKLASDDSSIGVVSGGGPGIMEAANKGAIDAGGYSIGLGIILDKLSESPNEYTTHRMDFRYFFSRKVILAHIAQAYVYFPGGVGTMDEFFELATLIATKKLDQNPIVILVGKEYWEGLFSWMKTAMVEKYGTLSEDMFSLWRVTDDADEAYRMLDRIPSRIRRSDSV
jgi:hypothetical protein